MESRNKRGLRETSTDVDTGEASVTPLDLHNWTLSFVFPKVEGKNTIPRCFLEASPKRLRKWVSPPIPRVPSVLVQGHLDLPFCTRCLQELGGLISPGFWGSLPLVPSPVPLFEGGIVTNNCKATKKEGMIRRPQDPSLPTGGDRARRDCFLLPPSP